MHLIGGLCLALYVNTVGTSMASCVWSCCLGATEVSGLSQHTLACMWHCKLTCSGLYLALLAKTTGNPMVTFCVSGAAKVSTPVCVNAL